MFNAAKFSSQGQSGNAYEETFKSEHIAGKKKVTYEQPLNERARSWLRLEYLFSCVTSRIKSLSTWDSRAAVDSLIEILDFIGRTDIKVDLIKDLERHIHDLERWQQSPGVDQERLQQLVDKLSQQMSQLTEVEGQIGQELSQHYLINSVRQRSAIPGGACNFDLPAYHHWLQRNPRQRQNNLAEWIAMFEPLQEAVELHLYLVRNNANPSQEIATAGFFQAKLDTQVPYQIVRVSIPADYGCYPEISGGKHRFTIRFLEYENIQDQPVATKQDVHFELCCCAA